jgi:hypothetical protein
VISVLGKLVYYELRVDEIISHMTGISLVVLIGCHRLHVPYLQEAPDGTASKKVCVVDKLLILGNEHLKCKRVLCSRIHTVLSK